MDLAFPLRYADSGRFAVADPDEHLQDMIAQVLFTLPGERLNLPEFGVGVQRLVFAPMSEEAVQPVRYAIQAQLQSWLSEYLRVESVAFDLRQSEFSLVITYVATATRQRRMARFSL